MIHRISGVLQHVTLTVTMSVGDQRIQSLPLEVDGRYYPSIVGDDINPPESEKFEITAVRILINEEWIKWQLPDYAALEEQILESIV